MKSKQLYKEILEQVKKRNIDDQRSFNRLKLEVLKKHNIDDIPTNIDIASVANTEEREQLKDLLTIKPVRTTSGVSVVAIMSKPIACPHGKCIYCPGGPDSAFGDVPMSYTGKEPATRRAIRNMFDSYLQTANRLEQYMAMNKVPDKIELIIMGGTFPSFQISYQEEFIKYSFRAMNDFSDMFFSKAIFNLDKFLKFFELPADINNRERTEKLQQKLLKTKKSCELEQEQLRNEKSNLRCVALCIETKPDFAKEKETDMMLNLGTTRVELGVQTIYDEVLKKTNRGHTILDTIKATQLLKDSLLKVGYHMMPGLPWTTKEMDINSLKEIVVNPDFRPDALKIYPCMVMKGTALHKLWKRGVYRPLNAKKAAGIIAEFKKHVPKYLRIMRVQRDIPTMVTEAGVEMTNLRQYLHKKLEKKNIRCRCLRCREPRDRKVDLENVKILREDYEASNSTEIFISAEDVKNDMLIGFCRLRKPYKPFRREITERSMGIRELHVYGQMLRVGEKSDESTQHKGFGKRLVAEAERISKEEFDSDKMVVISGVGAREYYKKLGYRREGPYMVKSL